MNYTVEFKEIKIKTIAELVGIEDCEILAFRPDGYLIRDYIMKNIIFNMGINERLLILNFEDIEACDVSCADEIILELINLFIKEKRHLSIIIKNVEEDVLDNIRAAKLYKQDKLSKSQNSKIVLPFFIENNDTLEIIGDMESNLLETYKLVEALKVLTARDLSNVKNLAINNASNRLKKLFDLNLIIREVIIDESGKFYEYKSIS